MQAFKFWVRAKKYYSVIFLSKNELQGLSERTKIYEDIYLKKEDCLAEIHHYTAPLGERVYVIEFTIDQPDELRHRSKIGMHNGSSYYLRSSSPINVKFSTYFDPYEYNKLEPSSEIQQL